MLFLILYVIQCWQKGRLANGKNRVSLCHEKRCSFRALFGGCAFLGRCPRLMNRWAFSPQRHVPRDACVFIVAQHITKYTIIFAARLQKPATKSVIWQEIYLKIKHANILIVSVFLRREGDSNPRNAFDVYTLSRRASSTTRASLLWLKLHVQR